MGRRFVFFAENLGLDHDWHLLTGCPYDEGVLLGVAELLC